MSDAGKSVFTIFANKRYGPVSNATGFALARTRCFCLPCVEIQGTRGLIHMNKILPFLCWSALAAAGVLPAAPAWADVKAGVDAWSAGNYEAAVREWKVLADRGDPDAQFNLAQAYKLGRGVPTDLARAEELYGQAAARGHLQAADTYGLLLFQRGEREKALPYLEASAARGDARAQYILGVAHFNGDLVRKDWIRAYALVTLARQAGLPQATNALAQMDQHIPLADRQKSVILSTQMAADAEATRARMAAAAELGAPPSALTGPPTSPLPSPPPRIAAGQGPEIVSPERAVAEATRVAGADSPATAGADFTNSAPPKPAAKPAPAPVAAPPKPASPPPAAPPKAAAAPKPAPAASAAASGPWRVQLGAFGVASNADALWAKVRGRPELAGHGKLLVPAGRLTKLQAGGFATKPAADAACARLSASGFTCLAVRD